VDAVFCSHGHSDHLDPGTLPHLAENNPSCRFVIPQAVRETALAREVPEGRVIALDSGDGFEGEGGLKITALASAHEELSLSERGEQLCLGYVIDFGGFSLYHSGDCVPYEGLAETLGQLSPDLFLLPVNGRDRKRTEKGILGNFTLEEPSISRKKRVLILHRPSFRNVRVQHDRSRSCFEDTCRQGRTQALPLRVFSRRDEPLL
jgi:L-ascorbate metabolism protein UlaG (beta-lactamase superfamily)